MTRNPYQASLQEPSLLESIFVFMDILGYSELIANSLKNGTQEQTLRNLHAALSKARKVLENNNDTYGSFDADIFALKAFTDNIVIGWPVDNDAVFESGIAFTCLAEFQLQMAIEGFFVRGALAVAPAYIDDIAVFGEALVEAYHGENHLARDPRIILTNTAMQAAKRHLKYYPDQTKSPHVRAILKDSDGQWFINYLDCVLSKKEDGEPYYEELMQHKAAVEQKLADHKSNPPVWSKYAWVASYHNYFCDLHPHHFSTKNSTDSNRIDVGLFQVCPSLIV